MHKVRWHRVVHNLGTENAVKVAQESTNWHRLSPHPTETGTSEDAAIRMGGQHLLLKTSGLTTVAYFEL